MEEKDFIVLFKTLLKDVINLYPIGKLGGLEIYSSKNKKFFLPVILDKEGFKIWYRLLDANSREMLSKKRIDGRAAFISTNKISIQEGDSEPRKFQFQLVVNSAAIKQMIKYEQKDFRALKIEMNEDLFVEATFVAYICHEMRHLIQLVKFQNSSFYHTSLRKISKDLISRPPAFGKIREYNNKEIAYQMKKYGEFFADLSPKKRSYFVKIEKDALIVGALSFLCWLDQGMTRKKKIKKLQEILHSKKQ